MSRGNSLSRGLRRASSLKEGAFGIAAQLLLNCKVYGFARGSPFGRAGALAPERARMLTAAPRFRRKRRCKCRFPLRPLP